MSSGPVTLLLHLKRCMITGTTEVLWSSDTEAEIITISPSEYEEYKGSEVVTSTGGVDALI